MNTNMLIPPLKKKGGGGSVGLKILLDLWVFVQDAAYKAVRFLILTNDNHKMPSYPARKAISFSRLWAPDSPVGDRPTDQTPVRLLSPES